jgi:predicted DNA binding CopG/RHH family protein
LLSLSSCEKTGSRKEGEETEDQGISNFKVSERSLSMRATFLRKKNASMNAKRTSNGFLFVLHKLIWFGSGQLYVQDAIHELKEKQ